ncbi:MAG: hypothetical protein KDE35_05905 [Geminicoccaceae bacterium]|nr:hypothetical protein [Geminicoccaceae bacterium]
MSEAKAHRPGASRALLGLLLVACSLLGGCAAEEPPDLVYCYRTLADVSCYDEPDQGREGRLVGTFERAPNVVAQHSND